ncbi:MAG: CRISPR-associated helicase Cas3' [Sutterellaceae bacterium]|nr:CRISPR-associated helicase Cas3' [Burkholderiaceae bacterium]MDW8430087.1 CRISPR-associated helicase Cas3' [Sutterellaceae bacterium]
MEQPDPFRYWGKARPENAHGPRYHLLAYHGLDVAATGRTYLQGQHALLHWMSQQVGVDDSAMLNWLTFWLALHDLGKFATSFQNQRPDLLEQLQQRSSPKAYAGARHDALGELLWRQHLLSRADAFGLGAQAARFADRIAPWAFAATGHHGEPPDAAQATLVQHFDTCDEQAAAAFAAEVRSLFHPDAVLTALCAMGRDRAVAASRLCSWWFAGIAVLADWIGSNTQSFPYETEPRPLSDYWQNTALPRAQRAIEAAGVLPQPAASGSRLQDIFTRERIPTLTPLQAWADTRELPRGPQLYLLEDVTGAGKTEAALTLAYRLMAQSDADGIFVGLPTMATANAMFERVIAVTNRLFAPQARPSVILAHGRRDLVPSFRTAVLAADHPEADPQQADDTASARCASWLADHNKKALLASVGVGTIDQALLAVLPARHQSLRLLGLFRKVLIVDEVHACDAYMQELLEGLLQFHAAAGGSAILVSATLTGEMKRRLAAAFASGCNWRAPELSIDDYPLITRVDAGGVVEHAVRTRPEVQRRVDVTYTGDLHQVIAAIRAAAEAGRCVCWVRNTVADAIEAWERIRCACPQVPCTLFHARFALGDRLTIESELLSAFGPVSRPTQRQGRVVIATQVIEQSLDVDFDVVISDLAPIDRLIQRSGRQQRHARDGDGAPIRGADQRGRPHMIVFGPPWTDAPTPAWFSSFFPRAAGVYAHHGRLWLTARELLLRGGFSMPEDARALIESVFGTDAKVPAGLQASSNEAEGKDWAAVNMAFASRLKIETGYARGSGGTWLSDDAAPALESEDGWDLGAATRQGETTVNVRLGRWEAGACVPWCAGEDAWELSTVRVIARYIKEPIAGPAQQVALQIAKGALPDQGKWSILLPLSARADGIWEAQARDHRGRVRRWLYDRSAGLREASADGSRLDIGPQS